MIASKRRACLLAGLALGAGSGLFYGCSSSSSAPDPNGDASTSATRDAGASDAKTPLDASTDALPEASTPVCNVDTPFGAPTLVSELDLGNDSTLRLSADYLTAFFASTRGNDAGVTELYSAARLAVSSPFSGVVSLSALDLPQGSANPSVTGDGLTMYFNGVVANSNNVDIYSVTRGNAGAEFIGPTQVTPVNTPGVDDTPFIREDGNVLYFASDNANASGLFRLYASTRSNAVFSSPVAIEELNSVAGNEDSPVVTPDGLVMYFASQRTDATPLGGYDVWVATRASAADPFGAPREVVEVSSSSADKPTFITRDRCTLYEQRTDGSGPTTVRNIYMATKAP